MDFGILGTGVFGRRYSTSEVLMRASVLKSFLTALACLGLFSGCASMNKEVRTPAATRGPIVVSANLFSGKYSIQIAGWQDDQGNLLPPGGSQTLTLTNANGEVIEKDVVVNSPYGNNTLDAVGNTYEILFSLGDRLTAENGMSGFIKDLQNIAQDKSSLTPASTAPNYDFVVALMNQKTGNVVLVDTAKFTVAPR
jgi:hypothetical protein